jgi:hypothetical protein
MHPHIKLLLISGLTIVSSAAFCQINNPALLYQNGKPVEVIYGAYGGWSVQDAKTGAIDYEPVAFTFGNLGAGIPFIMDTLNTTMDAKMSWSIHRAESAKGGISRLLNVDDSHPAEIDFPACNPAAKGSATLGGKVKGKPNAAGTEDPTPAMKTAIQNSNPWTLGSYSLQVDGFDTTKCTVDPYVWKMADVGDLDGDGLDDFVPDLGSLSFRCVSDGKGQVCGTTDHFRMAYTESGGIVIVLDGYLTIETCQPDDVFQDGQIAGTAERVSGKIISLKASSQ